jgi:cell wall-associated NlpC family hydrolase
VNLTRVIRKSAWLAVLVLTAGIALPTTAASATPTASEPAPTAAETNRMVESLARKMADTSEESNDAKVEIAESQVRQAALTQKLVGLRGQVDQLAKQTGMYAANSYKRGGNAGIVSTLLANSSPRTLLDQLTTMQALADTVNDQIGTLMKARKALYDQQAAINKETAIQTARQKVLTARNATLKKDMATWSALQAKLSPWARQAAARTDGSRWINNQPTPPMVPGRAGVIVRFAYSQLGKPYVFGADGPFSFDCSGLTLAAYHLVGVSLPHSAHLQYARMAKVSRDALQPGDLVFFYSRGHVGIYVGDGKVIHAPQPGERVKLASLGAMPFAGASRG